MKYSKEMRKNAGLTQARLSEIAGIARVYLARVETGRGELSSALDLLLCKICEGVVTSGNRDAPISQPAQITQQTIPVVGMASAAHFDPSLSNISDLWECSDDRIPCVCAHAEELFGIRISGDSMSPALMDGDIVAVSDRLPATGDTCIALHRTDGILCKRWYWRNGVIRLESINPDGKTYEWDKKTFTAESPLVWRFKVEALVYRKL